jgi:cytochrome P450
MAIDAATPRTFVAWTLAQGIPRLALRSAARRGDLVAATAIDPRLRADPFAAYDRIRSQGPVVDAKLLSATASHAVANEVLRSEAFGVGPGTELGPRWMNRLLASAVDTDHPGPVDPPSLLAVDPPDHTRYRKLVSKVFTPRALEGLRPRIRELAHTLLDGIAADTPFDLVERYAKVLPLTMICEILGVPEGLRADVRRTADAGALLLDPGLTWRQYRFAEAAVRDAHRQLGAHIDELRRRPGDDLLSQLAQRGELTDLELRATALLVIGAGFETTVNLIANAVVNLLEHPEQLATLRADPSGWPNAVEEVLRYDSPVQVTIRHAKTATRVGGVDLPAGRPMLVILAAANRDPAVFAEPHRFDVTRANAREHLAFSAGVHFCLGATLARIEAATALEVLFERVPDLATAGRPVRRGTRVLRGYDHLPVRGTAVTANT